MTLGLNRKQVRHCRCLWETFVGTAERRSPGRVTRCLSENMSGDTLLTQGGNNHYTSSSILDTSSDNILYREEEGLITFDFSRRAFSLGAHCEFYSVKSDQRKISLLVS